MFKYFIKISKKFKVVLAVLFLVIGLMFFIGFVSHNILTSHHREKIVEKTVQDELMM